MSCGALRIRAAAEGDLDAVGAFAPDDPVRFVTPEAFADERAAGSYRAAWTWLAADDAGLAARAVWFGRATGELPLALDCVTVARRVADPAALGASLLAAAHAAFRTAGLARPPHYELRLAPGWRDEPALAAAVAWRRSMAAAAGLGDELERIQLAWTAGMPLPAGSGRLRLSAEPDDAVFLDLFRRVAAGSLDADTRRAVAASGAEAAAREDLAFYRAAPGDRDWWRVARTADGALAGFVIPSATERSANVGYLGVVPALRGRGLVDDLLACAVRLHASRGATRVTATTDVANATMAAAFARAGFSAYERRLVLSAP
jgi:RimJ/RimL family protein N-acetyltransferase